MRRVSIFLAAAALAGLLVVSAASAGAGGTARPFQATLTGVVTYVVPAACPGDPPDIANGGAFRSNSAATGEVSHLGRLDAGVPWPWSGAATGAISY